ncbi:hypothetical protein WLQ65_16670 [Pseudoalteromonas piscicida]|uniref:hypothetical protein n=1 Tax=Pseudoalteromonas piscicida TaxID=43662 RepID=UPI0030C936F9
MEELKHFYFFESVLFIRKTFLLWLVLTIFALIVLFPRLELILLGISREEIVALGRDRVMMLLTPISLVLASISILSVNPLRVKLVTFSLFIIVTVYSLSRAEILNLLFFLAVLISFSSIEKKKENIRKLFIYFFLLLALSAVITIYQGRSVNLERAVVNMMEALFKYSAFSMYLSEIVVQKVNLDFEKLYFPFFGFFSERFLSIFAELDNPIGVDGSSFVSEFHSLGYTNALSANVVYPWWPWFYALYGWIGLIFKSVYIYLLLLLFKTCNLRFSLLYFFYVLFFLQYKKHPFLNNDSVYFFVAIISLDLICNMFMKRRSSHHCE